MNIKLNETWRDKLFFTSDIHYGHKNIIDYCDRPFDSVEEMNNTLINLWNDVVPDDGLVFLLGDVAMKEPLALEFLSQVNGVVVLVKGNHDTTSLIRSVNKGAYKDMGWKYKYKMLEIIDLKVEDPDVGDPGMRMALCHYPMGAWNYGFHGAVQLYGHVHSVPGKDCYYKPTSKQIDVGVDANDFTPISYIDLMKRLTKKALKG